jgi:hypothetical protein
MKTDKNFKLSKSTKRILASMPAEFRNSYKRMMIDAEYSESRAKLVKVKEKQ